MKRALYSDLLAWKESDTRKPLVLRGARQTGKTWLLKTFGEKEYDSTIYLNFEEDPALDKFFQNKMDPEQIIQHLSLYLNVSIIAQKTFLIFDEIQASTAALNSLKYFHEKANQYHIAAAGSLLGVKLGQHKGFPVGQVTFLDLYPLTFFEFLTAIGKDKLTAYLRQLTIERSSKALIPEPLHQELLGILKLYMVVGGMPEAVNEYIHSQNLQAVRKIQTDILDAYALDFAKYAPRDIAMKISKVWESIPTQLAKENKKFKWSDIQHSARAREYESTVEWLADAGLIYRSYSISVPKFPLLAYSDKSTFKLFLLDVGLLSAMSRLAPQIILEGNELFTEFKGAFTENLVAQSLIVQQELLYYWASEGRAEIDFIIEHNNVIYPLEVKSGQSAKKKSMQVYDEKYKPKGMLRASLMNLKYDDRMLNLPLYLAVRLCDLIPNF